jgi:hypothetical protein
VGYELIDAGHPVLWTPTSTLVQRLLAAKRDLRLPQELAKLDKFACVILDDIGYVQQDRDEMEVLFTFLAERYERKSVMITTNLVFSEWERIFKDPMTTMVVSSDDQLQGPMLRSSELTLIIYWMYRPKRRSSYIMAAIDRLVHHSVILDMMSVESYRAEVASQQHLPAARSKKQPSKHTSLDEAMTPLRGSDASLAISAPSANQSPPASLLVADATPAHLLVAEHADIETREVATSHRHV